jgi:hypothetical protein
MVLQPEDIGNGLLIIAVQLMNFLQKLLFD